MHREQGRGPRAPDGTQEEELSGGEVRQARLRKGVLRDRRHQGKQGPADAQIAVSDAATRQAQVQAREAPRGGQRQRPHPDEHPRARPLSGPDRN